MKLTGPPLSSSRTRFVRFRKSGSSRTSSITRGRPVATTLPVTPSPRLNRLFRTSSPLSPTAARVRSRPVASSSSTSVPRLSPSRSLTVSIIAVNASSNSSVLDSTRATSANVSTSAFSTSDSLMPKE